MQPHTQPYFRIFQTKALAMALLLAVLAQPFIPLTAHAGGLNFAPANPTVTASNTGTTGVGVTFTVQATDPEGDKVDYGFDWDNDGTINEYTGYVDSGTEAQAVHTWNSPGTYTYTVSARDPWNHYSDPVVKTITITDAAVPPAHVNVAPNTPTVLGPTSVTVNTAQSFTINAVDPEGDDLLYGVDWDNNGTVDEWTSQQSSGISAAVSHSWNTAGPVTFKVYAKDVWSAVSSAYTYSLTVDPAAAPVNLAPTAPTVTSSGDSINQLVTFTAQATDPEGDKVDYGFDWDNDGTIDGYTGYVTSGTAASLSHTFTLGGTYPVKVYARDPWNHYSPATTQTVTITSHGTGASNSAPNTPVVLGTTTGVVGTAYSFTANAVDPQANDVSYTFDWGDGSSVATTAVVPSGISAALSHTWATAGTYTVSVTAKDSEGSVSPAGTLQIIITAAPSSSINTAPTDPVITASSTATINSLVAFTARSTDPNGDQIAYGFDWDANGTVDDYTSYVQSGTSASISHSWPAAGTYNYTVVARDAFNNYSNIVTQSIVITTGPVVITNVAPNVPVLLGTTTGVTGAAYSFTANTTDPEGDALSYTFNWGDGSSTTTESTESGLSLARSHAWATAGTYTISLTATDSHGAVSGAKTMQIVITGTSLPTGTISSFTLSPNPIASGGTSVATWSSSDASVCEATGAWSGYLPISGTQTVGPFFVTSQTTMTFVLACGNANGTSTQSVDLTVGSGGGGGTTTPSQAPTVPTVTVVGNLVNTPIAFTAQSTDPQGDNISYGFDWNNDGGAEEWTAFATSGIPVSITHTFIASSTYPVQVFAKDPNGNTSSAKTVSVTVIASSTAPSGTFSITAAPGLSTSESGSTATFTVVLNSAPLADVSLPVMSSDFTEGTTSTTRLTFSPSNWNVYQTVTVTGIDDSIVDGNVPYTVTVGPSTSSDINFNGMAAQTVSLINNDNDSSGGGGGGSGGSSGGGGGGTYTGPCFGYNCPSNTNSTTSASTIPGDVWIAIGNPTTSAESGQTGPELVCPSVNLITSFLRKGIDNNPNEVRKLQYFLNTYEKAGLAVDGEFGTSTEDAVKAFQAKYSSDILAPWGTTTPTGIVYITTTKKINQIFCADHPDYNGQSLKDILDSNVLNNPDNSGQFNGAIGQATSTLSNIAGVLGAFSQKVLDALRSIPIYQVLILLLLILGIGFIIQAALIKDIESLASYAAYMRGFSVLLVATVLNVLNTLSFMLNPAWLADKTGVTLPWVLGLDMANGIAVIAISLTMLIMTYAKVHKAAGNGPTVK